MRYKDAFVLAADELRATSDCLTKLQRAIQRQESKQRKSSLKKEETVHIPTPTRGKIVAFQGKKGDVWSHDDVILPNGTEVVALVDEHSKPKLWILSSVVGYRGGDRPRYEVQDEDPGDEANPTVFKKRYVLDMKKVICLPSLADAPLNSRREFVKGDRVLALYPVGGATVLYPAVVLLSPKKRKDEYYLVEFEDDEGKAADIFLKVFLISQYVRSLLVNNATSASKLIRSLNDLCL